MTRLLLDCSVLIDHLRGLKKATDYLKDAVNQGNELWSVTIVRTEVLAGMRPREETKTMDLFNQIKWADVDVELADSAGALARRYIGSHQGVDTVDYLIAAATESLDADLATTNLKHYPMLPDLERAY